MNYLGDRSVTKDMYSILHILRENLKNKSMESYFDDIYKHFEKDDLGKKYIRNLLNLLTRDLYVEIFPKNLEKATKNALICFLPTLAGIDYLENYLAVGGLTILNEEKYKRN